jgi:hypothetical protein
MDTGFDPACWLFEAQRVAAGEIPLQRLLVAAFAIFNIVHRLDHEIVSMAVVLSAYFLILLLLPRFLNMPVMFCLIAVCGTSLMFFNLFSCLTYVPALQTGSAAFLLFLIGVLARRSRVLVFRTKDQRLALALHENQCRLCWSHADRLLVGWRCRELCRA